MQAGIFEYGNGIGAFDPGGAITATDEALPNPYQLSHQGKIVRSGVTVSSMTKTDWQGTYALYPTARTNLSPKSEVYGTSWTKNGTSSTANSHLAPDGSYGALILKETAVNSYHSILQDLSVISNATAYTFSFFIKPFATRRFVSVNADLTNGFLGGSSVFDTLLMSVPIVGAGVTASIKPSANGYVRISVTATSSGTWAEPAIGFGLDGSSAFPTYLGETTQGFYLWGTQLELGSSATGYIPTPSSLAVTVTDYAYTAAGAGTLGSNFRPGVYRWTGTGTVLPNKIISPTYRYNRMSIGLSGLGAETVSLYPSYDGGAFEVNALRPIDLATGALKTVGSTLSNGTYRLHETPWYSIYAEASAATSGVVRFSLLNAN